MLVSVSNTVQVWNCTDTRELSLKFASKEPLSNVSCNYVSWSHANQVIAYCGNDFHVNLMEPAGKPLARIPFSSSKKYREPVAGLSFSGNSRQLACGVGNQVHLWDLKKQNLLNEFKDFSGPISTVSIVQDGQIAVGDKAGIFSIIDTKSGSISSGIRQDNGNSSVECLDSLSSIQNPRVACGYDDGALFIWDMLTMQQFRSFNFHKEALKALCVSPMNPKLISTCGFDGKIYMNDVSKATPGNCINMHDRLHALSAHEDGCHIAVGTGSGHILLYDWRNVKSPVSKVEAHCPYQVSALKFQNPISRPSGIDASATSSAPAGALSRSTAVLGSTTRIGDEFRGHISSSSTLDIPNQHSSSSSSSNSNSSSGGGGASGGSNLEVSHLLSSRAITNNLTPPFPPKTSAEPSILSQSVRAISESLGGQSNSARASDSSSILLADLGVESSIRHTIRESSVNGPKFSPNIDSILQDVNNLRKSQLNYSRGTGNDSLKSSIDSDISNVSEHRQSKGLEGSSGNKNNNSQSNNNLSASRSMNSEVDSIIRDIEKKSKSGLNASISSSALNANNLANTQTSKFSTSYNNSNNRGDAADEQTSNISDISHTSNHDFFDSKASTANAANNSLHQSQSSNQNPSYSANRTSSRGAPTINNAKSTSYTRPFTGGEAAAADKHSSPAPLQQQNNPDYVTKVYFEESMQESLDSLKYDIHKEIQFIIREQIHQFEISREESKKQINSLTQMLQQLLQANQSLREENESLRRIYK